MASKESSTIIGSIYADNISLDSTDNRTKKALGLAGDDSFITRGKVAFKLKLYGGEGNDTFDSGSEVSDFNSSRGASQKNAVSMYGEGGNDRVIDSLGGSHVLSGGEGDDIIGFHTNNGRYYGYAKPDLVIDGGPGNDKISYFNFPLTKGVIRGGDGDDLIGIGGKSGGGGINYFGDSGDDVFSLRMLPEEKITNIDGGDGYDELFITYELSQALVRTEDFEGVKKMVFAFWQKNGVTQETSVSLYGIESVAIATDFIPYKWGNDGTSSTGALSDYWQTNGGFN